MHALLLALALAAGAPDREASLAHLRLELANVIATNRAAFVRVANPPSIEWSNVDRALDLAADATNCDIEALSIDHRQLYRELAIASLDKDVRRQRQAQADLRWVDENIMLCDTARRVADARQGH